MRYLLKTDFEECWTIFYSVFERHEDEVFLSAWKEQNPFLSFVLYEGHRIEAFLLTRGTHVEFIGVKKDHQGKGLGTILLHNLLDRCKRDSISISLVPSNSNPKLIRWYESNGFRKTGNYVNPKEQILVFSI